MSKPERTIRDYVTDDFRTAAVFQRHGLDFCCGGGVSLREACRKHGIDESALEAELDEAMSVPGNKGLDPSSWDSAFLVDHIVDVHHSFVRNSLPVILEHARKVAMVHGVNHPETVAIADHMNQIAGDLLAHMRKEEMILFPYLRVLDQAARSGEAIPSAFFGSVTHPIAMMRAEHEAAGDEMAEIRRLSHDYTPPVDACTTYSVLYRELAQFEEDLHRHVHLENNILFPRALKEEEECLRS